MNKNIRVAQSTKSHHYPLWFHLIHRKLIKCTGLSKWPPILSQSSVHSHMLALSWLQMEPPLRPPENGLILLVCSFTYSSYTCPCSSLRPSLRWYSSSYSLFGWIFSQCSLIAKHQSSSVRLLSLVRLFVTPWIAARQASLSIINSQSLPKLMSIKSVIPSSHLILCHPHLLPPIPPSIRVFSNESTLCMRWPKDWSFSFSISPYNEHPGLISLRMDWLDLLAVQGTLKSLLQHHSSKASILWCSAFFIAQLSHP